MRSEVLRAALFAVAVFASGCGDGGCGCGDRGPSVANEVLPDGGLATVGNDVDRHERAVRAFLDESASPAPLDAVKHAPIALVKLTLAAALDEVLGVVTYDVVNAGTLDRQGLVFALPATDPEVRSTRARVTAASVDGATAKFEERNGLVYLESVVGAGKTSQIILEYVVPVTTLTTPVWGDENSDLATAMALHAGANVFAHGGARRGDVVTLQHAVPYLLEPDFVTAIEGDKPKRANQQFAGLDPITHFLLSVEAPDGWTVAAPGVPADATAMPTWRIPAARTLSLSLSSRFVHASTVVDGVTLDSYTVAGNEGRQAAYVSTVAGLLPIMRARLGQLPFARIVVTEGAFESAGFGSTSGIITLSSWMYGPEMFDDPKTSLLDLLLRDAHLVAWRDYLLATALAQQWWGGVVGIDRYADLVMLEGIARETAIQALMKSTGAVTTDDEAGDESDADVRLVHKLALGLALPHARAVDIDAERRSLVTPLEIVAAFEASCAQRLALHAASGQSFDTMDETLLAEFGYGAMGLSDYQRVMGALASTKGFDIGSWWTSDAIRQKSETLDPLVTLRRLGKLVPRDASGTRLLRDLAKNREMASLLNGMLFGGGEEPDWEALLASVIDGPLIPPAEPSADNDDKPFEPPQLPAPYPGENPTIRKLAALTAALNDDPSPSPAERDRVNAVNDMIVNALELRR